MRALASRLDLELLRVPNTIAARDAEEVARRSCTRSILNHSVRAYVWGALTGINEGRRFDSEVLYVAALLHDIGLMPGFDTGRCFEADGEHFARELLIMLGWGPSRADLVANAIRDHWNGPESHDDVEALLLAQGAAIDVTGLGATTFDEQTVAHVVELLPREGFKREFVALLAQQAARKPQCHVHDALEAGFAGLVLAAPYDE